MDLKFPTPNVTCRCGTLLFRWDDVLEHWRRHREEQANADKMQHMMKDYLR